MNLNPREVKATGNITNKYHVNAFQKWLQEFAAWSLCSALPSESLPRMPMLRGKRCESLLGFPAGLFPDF